MTFWTDKAGNKLSFKEFMGRWKQGIEGVNLLQQTKMQLTSTWIIILGIILGIIVSIIAWDTMWWVFIILLGALINSLVQALGIWQKKQTLVRLTSIQDNLPYEAVKGGVT